MSIHKNKSVALKAAANAIRQSTGYGGLERVIAINQRSIELTGPNKSLSKFDKIKELNRFIIRVGFAFLPNFVNLQMAWAFGTQRWISLST